MNHFDYKIASDHYFDRWTPLKPFHFWCHKTLPLVYDDSLSYYEVLCKVFYYLNSVIEQVDALGENCDELKAAFEALQKFVNEYFDNLDLKYQVEVILEKYASDGTLEELLYKKFTPILKTILNELEALKKRMDTAEQDIDNLEECCKQVQATLETMNDEIEKLKARVTTNEGKIATNTTNIANNATNIQKNATDLSALEKRVTTNEGNISTNTKNIKTNADDIDSLEARVSTNETNIASNTSRIVTLEETTVKLKKPVTINRNYYFAHGDSARYGKGNVYSDDPQIIYFMIPAITQLTPDGDRYYTNAEVTKLTGWLNAGGKPVAGIDTTWCNFLDFGDSDETKWPGTVGASVQHGYIIIRLTRTIENPTWNISENDGLWFPKNIAYILGIHECSIRLS